MSVNPYINFNGNCREAVEFYSEVFGAEGQQIMTFGEMPTGPDFILPEEAENLVLHTWLKIYGSKVMFSDIFPGMPYAAGNNVTLAVVIDNMDEIKSIFSKLKEGGSVDMELQETFWSKCYGAVTDKFGIAWQFNYENEQ